MREGKSLSGHERNAMFLNTSDPRRRFSDVSAISGIDVDGDGRVQTPRWNDLKECPQIGFSS